MSSTDTISVPEARPSRSVWYVVAAVVLLAALLRTHELGDEGGLWLDEIWSVMNAAGKGSAIDALPSGAVQQPGTDWTEVGSVPWTKIWANTTRDVHPPGFYLVLRAWMAVFGESELAIRSLTVAFSLAAMPFMFLLGRATVGAWRAVVALVIYATCCGSIFYAQECRSYTMMQFWCVALAWVCWRIATVGATTGRLVAMGGLLVASAMTHYFFAGAAAGIVIWTVCCARREDRWKIAVAAVVAATVFGVTWGPMLWEQRNFWAWKEHLLDRERTPLRLVLRFLAAPARMLLPNAPIDSAGSIATGLAVMLAIPGFSFLAAPERRRGMLLWWAYLVGGIAFILAEDMARHGLGLEVPRYTSHLMPALCVLLVALFPVRRWPAGAAYALTAPAAVAIGLSCFWTAKWAYIQKAFWRDISRGYVSQMGPNDAIVFHSDLPNDWRPKMQYMCFSRYEGAGRQLPHVVLLGPDAPTGAAADTLARVSHVWVFSLRGADLPPPNLGPLRQDDVKPVSSRSPESPLSLRLMSVPRDGASTGPQTTRPQ